MRMNPFARLNVRGGGADELPILQHWLPLANHANVAILWPKAIAWETVTVARFGLSESVNIPLPSRLPGNDDVVGRMEADEEGVGERGHVDVKLSAIA